jgi:hypothetical protein
VRQLGAYEEHAPAPLIMIRRPRYWNVSDVIRTDAPQSPEVREKESPLTAMPASIWSCSVVLPDAVQVKGNVAVRPAAVTVKTGRLKQLLADER